MTSLSPPTGGPQSPPPQSPPTFVQTVLGEIGLFAALLYFGGWVYLNRYYSQFDIDVGLLEVDWHDVIVHSAALLKGGAVMMVKSPAVLSLLILPLMLWAAGHYLPRHAEIWKMAGILNVNFYFPLVALIVGMLVFLAVAQYVAAAQARRDWVASREPVVISFKDEKCGQDPYLKDANDKWQLRLLKATPKWYFVFRPSPTQNPTKALPIRVFHVPTACIGSVRRDISPH